LDPIQKPRVILAWRSVENTWNRSRNQADGLKRGKTDVLSVVAECRGCGLEVKMAKIDEIPPVQHNVNTLLLA